MSEVRASHILLMYTGSARSTATRSKAEALAGLQAIQQELNDGADFAAPARAHGDGPSGRAGGDPGFFGRGQMVPAFETAAFSLSPGQVREVIETDFDDPLVARTV